VLKVNLGTQTYNEKYDYYLPTSLSSGAFPPGSTQSIAAATATAQTITQVDRLAEFTLNYNKQFGQHHFDALAGYTAQKTTSDLSALALKVSRMIISPRLPARELMPATFLQT
jgi:hypothetical protein